jgi:NADP-dependent 3-hydroxy acid dehydrogenase YdfG/tetratricopeptide (TPR) repeat protein
MQRVLLAYSPDNQPLVDRVQQDLSNRNIVAECLKAGDQQGVLAFARQLEAAALPVLLFLNDNLLRSRYTMTGLLSCLQNLSQPLLVVLCDGLASDDGGQSYHVVPTQIDRMVHALHYMTHWQNMLLDVGEHFHENHTAAEKVQLEQELDAVRTTANEIADFITYIREKGYISPEQLQAEGYRALYEAFHFQASAPAPQPIAVPPVLPEPEPEPEPEPVALAPEAIVETPVVPEPAPQTEPVTPQRGGLTFDLPNLIVPKTVSGSALNVDPHKAFESIDHLLHAAEPTSEQEDVQAIVGQALADAQVWSENGHPDRALELLQAIQELYPDDTRLETAIQNLQKTADAPAPQLPEPVTQEIPENNNEQEARSYELMGDMAHSKGDYLYAKYCWDKVMELDPEFKGIYMKLGTVCAEQLPEYSQTAQHYLQQALLRNPKEARAYLLLAKLNRQNGASELAMQQYHDAVTLDPELRTRELDLFFFVPAAAPELPSISEAPAVAEVEVVAEPAPVPETPAAVWPEELAREVLTILITGASSGIGRASAELFARNGHRVILAGRRVEKLSGLKTQLEDRFRAEALVLPLDVRDQQGVAHVLDHLPENWKNIDILLNNAGLAKGLAPIQEGDLQHWETMIDTNIKGLLYMTRAIAPGMVARKRGHIINISSSAGKEVYANGNVYCATKFAVEALTRSMRIDLHAHNIRVSQVSPGHVEETEFAITRFDGDAQRAKIYEDFQPLRASDVAESIYFIATRPPHVNIQDIWMFSTQQASATIVNRSGR